MDYYLPLVRFIGRRTAVETAIACMNKGDSSTAPFRSRGFLGMDKTWNADFDNAKATMKEYNIKLHPPSVQLFKRFIQECKEMDIQPILVCTPEYIEGQEFVVNRASIIKLYEAISVEHEVPFLDYSNDTICLNKNLFYNALHLNKTGADIFTKKLVGQLPPILQNGSFSAQ